jgi:hypothetical protein
VTARERVLAIAAWTLGDLLGIAVLAAALRRAPPLRVLRCAALVAALALAAFWQTRSLAFATLALGLVGAASISLHPLLKARAYAALPGRPALVNALAALLAPAHLAAPLALAACAGAHGAASAVGVLCLAPAFIAVAALRARQG